VTVTLGLDGSGKVDIVAGGYEDWQKQKTAPTEKKAPPRPAPASEAPAFRTRTKLSYKDQRDLDLLPTEIERMEDEITRDEAALADPDLYARDPARFDALSKAIEQTRAKKEEAEIRWLELAEKAEL
jgi:ATP-binding cassette subfamily F protein uup